MEGPSDQARNCVTWKCTKQSPMYYRNNERTASVGLWEARLLNDTHAKYVNGDETS